MESSIGRSKRLDFSTGVLATDLADRIRGENRKYVNEMNNIITMISR